MSSIVQHAPRFSEEEAANISKDLYGLDAAAKLLPSERDQNFHLAESGGVTDRMAAREGIYHARLRSR